jgi:hypothetical protein
LCREFDFYEVKKNWELFLKRKGKYFYNFNQFYSKVFKKSKIAQIYYYDPQSAGINLQSPQSESTPRRLTLGWSNKASEVTAKVLTNSPYQKNQNGKRHGKIQM